MKVYEKPIPFGDAVRFHGHSGPFLALGFKAGSYAMGKLHPEGIKDIACRINTIMSTPYTCIIDGIQCSSHCTLGKGNLVSTKRIHYFAF
jgi:formylmethanofuran dehydrogenase subunit E